MIETGLVTIEAAIVILDSLINSHINDIQHRAYITLSLRR